MNQITFLDLYLKEGKKPTPRQAFIADVAKVTKKSQITIKNWINGRQVPDALTVDVIAKHFNCDPSALFPAIAPKKSAR